jgi:hypothetical protein
MVIVTGTYLLIIHFCKFNFQQLPSLLVSLLFLVYYYRQMVSYMGGEGKK